MSPDELCGVEWILASSPFELGGLPVVPQLSARSHADSGMSEWNAYFTLGVPHEAITELLVTLDAREVMPCADVWVVRCPDRHGGWSDRRLGGALRRLAARRSGVHQVLPGRWRPRLGGLRGQAPAT
ncbi:DUF317 domain-containing protein [Streptomyces sp. NPDC050164]|uniref:DUF317 domain-containing protein n=1 Tax=Streptomyces sp. NPDC050164 TaxID=3365605 RepID=UPI0037B462B7